MPSGAVPGDVVPGDVVPGDVVPGDAVPGRVVTSASGVTGDSVAAAPPERGGAGAAARGGAETSTVTVRFAHAATIAAGTSIETANAQIRWFIMIPPGSIRLPMRGGMPAFRLGGFFRLSRIFHAAALDQRARGSMCRARYFGPSALYIRPK